MQLINMIRKYWIIIALVLLVFLFGMLQGVVFNQDGYGNHLILPDSVGGVAEYCYQQNTDGDLREFSAFVDGVQVVSVSNPSYTYPGGPTCGSSTWKMTTCKPLTWSVQVCNPNCNAPGSYATGTYQPTCLGGSSVAESNSEVFSVATATAKAKSIGVNLADMVNSVLRWILSKLKGGA